MSAELIAHRPPLSPWEGPVTDPLPLVALTLLVVIGAVLLLVRLGRPARRDPAPPGAPWRPSRALMAVGAAAGWLAVVVVLFLSVPRP